MWNFCLSEAALWDSAALELPGNRAVQVNVSWVVLAVVGDKLLVYAAPVSYVGGYQHPVICLFQACPDSVRTRVSDTEFGRTFLKDIPVLQWARHATRVQYERLSGYPGSHGWGGVQYNGEFHGLAAHCTFTWSSWGEGSSWASIIAPVGARRG